MLNIQGLKHVKNILIIGSDGEFGKKMSNFLTKNGINTILFDDKSNPIKVDLDKIDMIYVSPGVPMVWNTHPLLVEANKRLIPRIGDLDLLYAYKPDATFIGVTGTDGKSTITTLISHILKHMKIRHLLGGNLAQTELFTNDNVFVLEVSNTLLEKNNNICFDCAIISNIESDHLDIQIPCEYMFYKYKIFKKCPQKEQIFVVGPTVKSIPFVNFQQVKRLNNKDSFHADWNKPHNKINAELVFTILNKKFNLSEKDFLKYIQDYEFPPYRQAEVIKKNDILIINDSKATNVNSCMAALESYENIYWIAGGIFKDSGLEKLLQNAGKIKEGFFFGRNKTLFYETFKNHFQCYIFDSLEEIIEFLYKKHIKGTILFSPACASYDQFKNFTQRGEFFNELIKKYFDK